MQTEASEDTKVRKLLKEHFNIEGSIKELGSYSDKNYLVKYRSSTDSPVKRFILKISSPKET